MPIYSEYVYPNRVDRPFSNNKSSGNQFSIAEQNVSQRGVQIYAHLPSGLSPTSYI